MEIRVDSWKLRYGFAFTSVCLATGARLLLDPVLGDSFPFATLFFAVMVAAWYGGFGPSVMATIVSAIASARFLLAPRDSFAVNGFDNHVGMLLYLTVSLGIALLGGRMRFNQLRAENQAHDLRRKQAQIETTILEQRRAEEQLRVTLQSIGDAVISTDEQGRVTFMNPVAVRLTGWAQGEASGRSLLEVFNIVNERTRNPVENPAFKALREGRVIGLANHTILIAKNGSECSIDDSAAPIRNQKDEIIGVVLIFRDITERRSSEMAILKSESLKSAIVNTSLDGIITLDHEGTVIDFNPAAEQVFGYRRNEILGREMAELIIPPALRDAHRRGIAHYLRTGEGPALYRRLELTAVRSNGEEFPVEISIAPITLEGLPVFTGYIRDISRQKKDADELKTIAAKLTEADRRKNEFLAMLAHELRNPLAPIRNALHILRMTKSDEPAVVSASAMMERQVSQMVRLVDDLLDISRISRGKIELRRERLELASIIQQAVEACRPALDNARHELKIELPTEPVYVNGDPARLAQVMGNILSNACKFTANGGRIRLTVERAEDSLVEVRIGDNGIGIAAPDLPRIFEMFLQLDTSLERSVSGLGIGLTLVKDLVKLHDGSVEVRSEGVGRGTEFVVRLPLLDKPQSVSAAEPNTAPKTKSTSRRFLVVDDNVDSAISLATLLNLLGNETATAHDGLAAVEATDIFKPDVVLLDIGLPKLNGYEACRRIRELTPKKELILIALTGWGQEEDRRRSQEAGFDAHLVKPVDHAVLIKLLRELRNDG